METVALSSPQASNITGVAFSPRWNAGDDRERHHQLRDQDLGRELCRQRRVGELPHRHLRRGTLPVGAALAGERRRWGPWSGTVTLWDMEAAPEAHRVWTIDRPAWYRECCAFDLGASSDGATLAVVYFAPSGERGTSVRDVATGAELFFVPADRPISIRPVDLSPDGRYLAVGADSYRAVRFLDRSGDEVGTTLREDGGFLIDRFGSLRTAGSSPSGPTGALIGACGSGIGSEASSSPRSPSGSRTPRGGVHHLWFDPGVRSERAADRLDGEPTGEDLGRRERSTRCDPTRPAQRDRSARVQSRRRLRRHRGIRRERAALRCGFRDADPGAACPRRDDTPVALVFVRSVAFSPDGSLLASVDGTTVRVWALEIDDLLEMARQNVTRSFTDEECRQYLHLASCATASAGELGAPTASGP